MRRGSPRGPRSRSSAAPLYLPSVGRGSRSPCLLGFCGSQSRTRFGSESRTTVVLDGEPEAYKCAWMSPPRPFGGQQARHCSSATAATSKTSISLPRHGSWRACGGLLREPGARRPRKQERESCKQLSLSRKRSILTKRAWRGVGDVDSRTPDEDVAHHSRVTSASLISAPSASKQRASLMLTEPASPPSI